MSEDTPSYRPWTLAAWILLPAALLIHLGAIPLHADEPIRALVAYEMILRDDYLVPTLFGELYFKKPPLYNWLLVPFLRIFGTHEFWVRLPSVLALVGYMLTVRHYAKRHFKAPMVFVATFALLTGSRMLFYDSFHGLIDITFSWVIFALFMVVYHEGERKRWVRFFVGAFFLGAVGFLLKHLPAVIFLGGTAYGYLLWRRQWKALIHPGHLLGLLAFLIPVGGYYFLYGQEVKLDNVFSTLIRETLMRAEDTGEPVGFWGHLAYFPIETLIDLLPWGLLVLLAIRKGIWAHIKQERFLVFCVLVVAVHILPYWISPMNRARYLFMLHPLLFFVLLRLWEKADWADWRKHSLRVTFLVVAGLATLSAVGLLVFALLGNPNWVGGFDLHAAVPGLWAVALGLMIGCGFVFLKMRRAREHFLVLLVVFLVVIRIGFNLIVFPVREITSPEMTQREDARRVAQKAKNGDLRIFKYTPCSIDLAWYLSTAHQSIVPRAFERPREGVYYLIFIEPKPKRLKRFKYLDQFPAIHDNGIPLYLILPRDTTL